MRAGAGLALLAGLAWLGGRARWALAGGVVAALLLPGLSEGLRPLLPGLVVLVFAVAVARLDILGALGAGLGGRGALRVGALTLGLLVATPALLWGAGRAVGLSEAHLAALVYTGAAPPITSAAGMCLLMGLDGLAALGLTVSASLAVPLLGPVVIELLIGGAVPVDPLALALRIGAMIAAGTALGLAARRAIGPARIAAEARAFDGVATLALLLFVVPLFDGVGALVAADPGLALGTFALAVAANYGMQGAVALAARRVAAAPVAGAVALAWGNRTVALYVAALPPDPVFGLYVALYQIPMLFTPLLMAGLLGAVPPGRARPD